MQFLKTVLDFAITLGVLVFVHELGHFLAAKLCGMRVDRFSIGFPPRAFGKKIGETDYCVSWLPIGGYVKIAGMVDESMDVEFVNRPPEPWEFRSRPIWQRTVVLSAGVVMNLILALVIFWGVHYAAGRTLRETTYVAYVAEGSPAQRAGFLAGDSILSVDNRAVVAWEPMLDALEEGEGSAAVALRRTGRDTVLSVERKPLRDAGSTGSGLVPAGTEIAVGPPEPGKPAERLGLKAQDVLIAINGTPIRDLQTVLRIVRQNAGNEITIEWRRGTEIMSGRTVPTSDGHIGIPIGESYSGPRVHISYSLAGALPAGARYMVFVTVSFAEQMWQLVTGKVSFAQSVGGPIKIAQLASQSSDLGLLTYLSFMALLSINLAIINILPFPALDGGHIAFLVYEAIFRREVPVQVKLGLQKVGIVVLLAFMAFVVVNDIIHF
ncbi:MAG TPA: RIP metalloprotease RseP [Bacteroidota bacterium]|nr:RIP metalloprotease RseP [Bacteroidota bacterium]